MIKAKHQELDFVIDQLTNSIVNVISGDSFATDIVRISVEDLRRITKRNG